MIPMERKPMKNLTKETQAIICKCKSRCKHYIYLDEYGRFCENSALNIAYNLILTTKGITKPQHKPKYREWTTKEEKFIKEWYSKGTKYGDRRIIADLLGREYTSVRSKISHMRERGEI